MRLKNYLIERTMNFNMALKVFGISADEVSDKDKLKKIYRRLAMKHHPDHGGSVEKAQDVNDAYAVLAKSTAKTTSKTDWDAIDKKYRETAAAIKTELLSNFKPDVYIQYFQELSGYKFFYEIVRAWPLEREKHPSSAGFEVEFFTKDRSTIFTMRVSADLHDVVYPKAELGFADLSYTVYTEAHGFHLNKKQKMSKSDWKHTRDHAFFRKPEMLFPKKKMKDIFSGSTSNRAFKKRDMITFLTKKLNASWNGDYAFIPLGDDYTLAVYRMVFMRVGTWGANGIYQKHSRVMHSPVVTFPETEETAKIFEKIQKEAMKAKGDMKGKKAVDILKKEYEDYKKSKGI